jgi:hypothetical protein
VDQINIVYKDSLKIAYIALKNLQLINTKIQKISIRLTKALQTNMLLKSRALT